LTRWLRSKSGSGDAEQARALAAKVSEELEILRAERVQVRSRIEKLLGKIDQLSGSP
jgi:hypothetical protein